MVHRYTRTQVHRYTSKSSIRSATGWSPKCTCALSTQYYTVCSTIYDMICTTWYRSTSSISPAVSGADLLMHLYTEYDTTWYTGTQVHRYKFHHHHQYHVSEAQLPCTSTWNCIFLHCRVIFLVTKTKEKHQPNGKYALFNPMHKHTCLNSWSDNLPTYLFSIWKFLYKISTQCVFSIEVINYVKYYRLPLCKRLNVKWGKKEAASNATYKSLNMLFFNYSKTLV